MSGKESVLLFISDLIASTISPDVKRLKGFDKIELSPGETKTVTFKIKPSDIAFVNSELISVTEPGEFLIQLGDQKVKFNYSQ